jgi:hypothetical protein
MTNIYKKKENDERYIYIYIYIFFFFLKKKIETNIKSVCRGNKEFDRYKMMVL